MSVSNIRKIMQYLAPVACSDIEVDGTVLKNDVRSIKLSEKFFDNTKKLFQLPDRR